MHSARLDAGRSRRRGGQAVTEFALIVPVLFVLIFGVLDGALLMFSVGTARYAAGEGSRVAAQFGNATAADDRVLGIIRDTVGQTTLFAVDEVDIYKLDQDGNGNLSPNLTYYNKYLLDGTPLISPEPWAASTRNVSNGNSDFLGVTIKYTYTWKAGFFAPLGPLKTNATYYIRLEPQSF